MLSIGNGHYGMCLLLFYQDVKRYEGVEAEEDMIESIGEIAESSSSYYIGTCRETQSPYNEYIEFNHKWASDAILKLCLISLVWPTP